MIKRRSFIKWLLAFITPERVSAPRRHGVNVGDDLTMDRDSRKLLRVAKQGDVIIGIADEMIATAINRGLHVYIPLSEKTIMELNRSWVSSPATLYDSHLISGMRE